MEMSSVLLQFLGSLGAILLLALAAQWLRLGREVRFTSEAEARKAAGEVAFGFDPVAVTLDRKGRAALLRDSRGQVMLLRPHGAHIAGRILNGRARASVVDGELHVDTAERRFGGAVLAIPAARAWQEAIAAAGGAAHA